MKAAVYQGNQTVSVENLSTPSIGPGELLVQVESCGICHTDLKKIEYDLLPGPRIYGHETAGTVAAVGEGVTRLKPGDRVIASCLVGCGKCHECMTVDHSTCSGGGGVIFGCQAEYYKVRFADVNAAKVPDGVSDDQALFATDIMSTGLGAIERARAGSPR